VSELTEDGMLVGANWSGPKATGYDLEPAELQRNVEALIADPSLLARTGVR